MDKNLKNAVNNVHEVVANKHKADHIDMGAMKEVYKKMHKRFVDLKNSNPSMEQALEIHKMVFLKSAGVNSEEELNQGQKMGLAGHMNSVSGKDAKTLLEMDIKILEKFIG